MNQQQIGIAERNGRSWMAFSPYREKASFLLFCFPYAGSGAQTFRPWSDLLPKKVEIRSLQLPGHFGRLEELPETSLFSLARKATQELLPFLDDRPFAFFGHSMGALLAFECIRLLRRQNRPLPTRLIVSGSHAPQIPYPNPKIHALPQDQFIERLMGFNGTPKEILEQRELMELVLPALRADFQCIESHEYLAEPPLDCPISAFGGNEDTEVLPAHLAAWEGQTLGSFRLRILEGDHFFLQKSQHLLLPALMQDLGVE